MKIDLNKLTEKCSWKNLTEGMQMYAPGTSIHFNTGEWTTIKPVYHANKCRHCLLCTPVCPDSCIPVKNYRRLAFDLNHCKGCGICAKVCPFEAIEMKEDK